MTNVDCPHQDASEFKKLCSHLVEQIDKREIDWVRRFTGVGLEYHLLCNECAQNPDNAKLHDVCIECFEKLDNVSYAETVIGRPEVFVRSTDLSFTHRTVTLRNNIDAKILDIQPINSPDSVWLALLENGEIIEINLKEAHHTSLFKLQPADLQFKDKMNLRLAPDNLFWAIVQERDQYGIVVDVKSKKVTMRLDRGKYRPEYTPFPATFFVLDNQLLLIHGTEWNRIDISNPQTGKRLTERTFLAWEDRKPPPHFLDYWHADLIVSPNQEWVAEYGWVWAPVGLLLSWNLRRWLYDNVWESEDGASVKRLAETSYYWNGPMCWIDDTTLAIWGFGDDDLALIPAVRICDVITGKLKRWFAGPEAGLLIFDNYLFSSSEKHGTDVWDLATGERWLHDEELKPKCYNRYTHEFLTIQPDQSFSVSTLTAPSK
jgi:hypothetical protein